MLTFGRCDRCVTGITSRNGCHVHAWVSMRITQQCSHLALYPLQETKVAAILKTLKQSVSKRAINWLKDNSPDYLPTIEDVQPNGKRTFRSWQRGGGYDRNLRSVRDIHEKIMYIHQNPVARRLASQSTDYRWSSAKAWETGANDPLSIDRDSVPSLTILHDRLDSKLMQ